MLLSSSHRLLPSPRRLGKDPSLSRLCLDASAVQPSSDKRVCIKNVRHQEIIVAVEMLSKPNLPSASVSLLKAFQLVTSSRLTSHLKSIKTEQTPWNRVFLQTFVHHVLYIPFVGNLSKSEVDSWIVFFLAPFLLFLLFGHSFDWNFSCCSSSCNLCDHLLVDVVQLHHGAFFFDFSELVLQSLDFLK